MHGASGNVSYLQQRIFDFQQERAASIDLARVCSQRSKRLLSRVEGLKRYAEERMAARDEAAARRTLQTKAQVQQVLSQTISRGRNNQLLAAKLEEIIGYLQCELHALAAAMDIRSPRGAAAAAGPGASVTGGSPPGRSPSTARAAPHQPSSGSRDTPSAVTQLVGVSGRQLLHDEQQEQAQEQQQERQQEQAAAQRGGAGHHGQAAGTPQKQGAGEQGRTAGDQDRGHRPPASPRPSTPETTHPGRSAFDPSHAARAAPRASAGRPEATWEQVQPRIRRALVQAARSSPAPQHAEQELDELIALIRQLTYATS